MQAASECARAILPVLEAMASGDMDALDEGRKTVDELEHRADELKHEIRRHLPKRLFMAVERRDMLEILDNQDSIADVAQDIAELADMRSMRVPEALREPLLELVRRVVSTCEHAQRIVNELDELLETGFGQRESARVEAMIADLGRQESETDSLAEDALRVIFNMEDELGVGTYFWYEMINWIGDMADYAERVGNRLLLLIAT
jgi:hypothetical protein